MSHTGAPTQTLAKEIQTMTITDTRPDFTPDFTPPVIDGEVGEVHEIPANPHRWTALTFAAAAVLSGAGLVWSMRTGQDHPEWAFVLLMVFIWLATRSAMLFEQFATANDPLHNAPQAEVL